MSRLTASQARLLYAADAEIRSAKRALEEAKERRDELLERLRDRLPAGQAIEAGGIRVKRIVKNTGRKFRLTEFEAKHKITKAMEPFITKPSSYEVLTVKDVSDEEASE